MSNDLHPLHLADIQRSGLSQAESDKAGIKSVPPGQINKRLGFNLPGLTSCYEIPYPGCDGFSRFRCFFEDGKKGPKYLQRKDTGNHLYIPTVSRPLLKDPSKPLYITEGEKKALKGSLAGILTIALGGLWNWRNGGGLIADFEKIALDGREVFIIPDNDYRKPNRHGYKKNLEQAVNGLAQALTEKGAAVSILQLPDGPEKGLDDYLLKHTVDDLLALPLIPYEEKRVPARINDDHRAADLIQKEPFPFDALPGGLRNFIFRAAEAHNLGPEIPGAIILSLASGAIGNTIAISPRPGWVTPLPSWLMIIGISGGGKSPIINTARHPLDMMQSKAYRQFQAEIRAYEKALRNNEKPGERPVLGHITASDTTVEGLSTVFRHTPRGITLINDELAGLIEGMNQYKARGNDRQFYLSLFDGIPWKIDRKKADPEFIPNPLAAILGGIQPRVLTRVFNDGAFDDGLLPRFLMVHCDDGPMRFSRNPLSREIIKPWEAAIDRCFQIPLHFGEDGFVERQILTFNDPALTLWANFHDDMGIIQPFLPEKARVFIPKFITYSLKLTGLLHALQELSEDGGGHIRATIREDTAAAGISLTRFFAGQAMRALSLYGKDHRETDGRVQRMVDVLRKLEPQVKGGNLPLNLIRETYNDALPGILKLTPDNRGTGAILRDLGLKTVRIHGGFYHLIWDQDRIGKIFHESAYTPKEGGADREGEGRGGQGHSLKEKLAFTQVVTTTHSVTVTQGFLSLPENAGPNKSTGNPGMIIDLDLSDEEIEVIE